MNNFSLSLLAFHLCQTLDDPPDRPTEGADAIWESFVNLGGVLPFPELQNLKQQLICYDPNGEFTFAKNPVNEWLSHQQIPIELSPITTKSGFQLRGNLQPFLLNDTYAVDLTLSPDSPDFDIDRDRLADFQPQHLLGDRINASLGQTLWLSGDVEADTDCETLAQELTAACLGGTSFQPQLAAAGKLLGIPLFEYEVREADAPEPLTFHIAVWLNDRGDNFDKGKASQTYNWLRDFVWSRYKVYAVEGLATEQYRRARTLYADLEAKVRELNAAIEDESDRLEQLNRLLKDLPLLFLDYRTCVRDLQAHRTAIAVNLQNYQTCLSHLFLEGDSVQAWQEFGDRAGQRILDRVNTHLSYLEPGQDFFADAINTVRALAAIAQVESDRQIQKTLENEQKRKAESDRSIERTIQILGAGLGAGGIVASGISGHIQTPISLKLTGNWKDIHPAIHTLIFSVLAAATVGIIVALLNGAIPLPRRQGKSAPK